jgi:hypothetical protein
MPRLFIGPVSDNVIDAALYCANANNIKLGLIPSRRQVDYDSGYVSTTAAFVDYVQTRSNNILIERDHGGPWQGIVKDDGDLSLYHDAEEGISLLHLDPFKKYQDLKKAAFWTTETIKLISSKYPDVRFEVGTEEAIFPYDIKGLAYFLELLGNTIELVEFVVIQTGAKICEFTNVDSFNELNTINKIKLIKTFSDHLKTKEHNGDFLLNKNVKKRVDVGLDAINVAPQYGIAETSVILDTVNAEDRCFLIDLFVKSNKWEKWLSNSACDYDKALYAGHYCFKNPEFIKIKYK